MQARWIFRKNAEMYEWCVFRRDFDIDTIADVKIDVSSLDRYVLYINGSLVSRGPAKSYNFAKFYDTLSIGGFLKLGKNTVVILSQFSAQAGVYARVYEGEKTLFVADEAWKTKKYEALDNLSEAKCPPLEPTRQNEEIYDARKCSDIFSPELDLSQWENAVFVHGEYERVVEDIGGFPSREAIYPEKFMGALAVADNGSYAFRLKNLDRRINEVRKCAAEIYFFEIISDSERTLDFCAGNVVKCSLNGEYVESSARLKKGRNLFAAYYCAADGDPYFVFESGEGLTLSEIELKGGSCRASVLNLSLDSIYFGWAYVEASSYKDSDGEAVIARALSAKKLSNFKDQLKPASVLEVGVSAAIENLRLGAIADTDISPSLKLKADFVSDTVRIENPEFMMLPGEEAATISGDSMLIFDFGAEKLGYLSFEICASEGTIVDFMGFEVVDFGGMRPMSQNCMRYVCRDGWQEFCSHYTRGMRYLCLVVRGSSAPVKISKLFIESANLDIKEQGSFSCDNKLVNEIYEMCKRTAYLCMTDSYVDCPGFEQVFWLNDAKVTSEVNLTNFGAFGFDYRCLSLIAESLSEEYKKFYRSDKSYLENKYLTPAAFGSYVYGGFPLASFHWGLGVCDYYLFSGDLEGAKKLYPYLKKMLANCENMMSERGLFAMEGAWNLLEWSENDLFPCCEVTANSALLAKLYKESAKLASALSDDSFAEVCQKRAKSIGEAINKYCWCEELGGFLDTVRDEYGYQLYLKFFKENGLEIEDFEAFKSYARISDQTNVIAYCSGVVREDRVERVKNMLLKILDPSYKTYHSSPTENITKPMRNISEIVRMGSPFLLYYFIKALADFGEYSGILDIIERNYGQMIECGTNTCWETFYNPGADKWTRSICHGWGASPAIYLLSEIVGVKPVLPGFAKFSIKPHLATLKEVKAKIPTPHGFISVEIDSEKGITHLDYPEECELVK